MSAEESTYVNVIASKGGTVFVLKGAFCESFKIWFLKWQRTGLSGSK